MNAFSQMSIPLLELTIQGYECLLGIISTWQDNIEYKKRKLILLNEALIAAKEQLKKMKS